MGHRRWVEGGACQPPTLAQQECRTGPARVAAVVERDAVATTARVAPFDQRARHTTAPVQSICRPADAGGTASHSRSVWIASRLSTSCGQRRRLRTNASLSSSGVRQCSGNSRTRRRRSLPVEADVYPRHAPEKSDLIDGAIGELSAFHQSYGYYAHGVDETTATLPPGWTERLVPIRNDNTAGLPAGVSKSMTWRYPSSWPAESGISSSSKCSCGSAWSIQSCSAAVSTCSA